jgi:hypothetical protein
MVLCDGDSDDCFGSCNFLGAGIKDDVVADADDEQSDWRSGDWSWARGELLRRGAFAFAFFGGRAGLRRLAVVERNSRSPIVIEERVFFILRFQSG